MWGTALLSTIPNGVPGPLTPQCPALRGHLETPAWQGRPGQPTVRNPPFAPGGCGGRGAATPAIGTPEPLSRWGGNTGTVGACARRGVGAPRFSDPSWEAPFPPTTASGVVARRPGAALTSVGAWLGRGRRTISSMWACPGRGLRQERNRCGRDRGVAKAQVHFYGAWLGWSFSQGWTRTSRDGTRGGARAGHAPPWGGVRRSGPPPGPSLTLPLERGISCPGGSARPQRDQPLSWERRPRRQHEEGARRWARRAGVGVP